MEGPTVATQGASSSKWVPPAAAWGGEGAKPLSLPSSSSRLRVLVGAGRPLKCKPSSRGACPRWEVWAVLPPAPAAEPHSSSAVPSALAVCRPHTSNSNSRALPGV